jgi:peptidoglycan/LPS O-acetylase OafA/YrhL
LPESIPLFQEVKPSKERSSHRFYRPELDGVRFYAFLGVFLFHTIPSEESFYRSLHAPLPWLWASTVKAGADGVDLFFTLSAFLITSLLLKEHEETGGVSLRLFYIRRILRIWPIYFVVIALGIVLAHTVPGENLPWSYVAAYLLFAGNWIHAAHGSPKSIAAPLWTVSIEEQFYLIWPVLAKKLSRHGMVIAAVIMFLSATVCRIIFVLTGVNGGYLYYASTSRCDSFALGILLALFAHRLPKLSGIMRIVFIAAGIAGCIIAEVWLNGPPGPSTMLEATGRLVISLSAGAMLYGSLYSHSKLLTGSWFVSLGKVSYGLYLLHLTGILIAKDLVHPRPGFQLLATKGLGLVVTVILALASYRWIESPFLRLKDRFARVLSRPV